MGKKTPIFWKVKVFDDQVQEQIFKIFHGHKIKIANSMLMYTHNHKTRT